MLQYIAPTRSVLPIACLVGLVVVLSSACADDEKPAEAKQRFQRGAIIRFEGTITRMKEQYLRRKLEDARQQNVDLLVVEIESPGGELEASQNIAAALRDLRWARTVAFVPNEALSGAAIMSLGCDDIVMHPQAKLGDAGPIYLDDAWMFQHAPEKIRSDLARHIRDLAESKGRPAALAEAMVDRDLEVFVYTNQDTGEVKFLSEHDLAAEPAPDRWEKGPLVQESRKGNFLEVNGQRAVALRLASANVADREALRKHYQLETPWIVLEPGKTDAIVYLLNRPFITGLLIVIGLIALYFEISIPGSTVGGLIAAGCFSLFFWSRFLGGTSGWLEVVMFVLGMIFLAVEIFILPGFGIAGFSGLLLMGASLIMASQDFLLPHNSAQLNTFATTVSVLAASLVVSLLAAIALGRQLKTVPIFSRLVLEAPSSSSPPEKTQSSLLQAPASNPEVSVEVGAIGIAESPLRPAGKILLNEKYTDVVTEGSFVEKGAKVKVVSVQGNRIVVREVS